MMTEKDRCFDPHTFSPFPKNPLLASFFVNIGRADTLGSGMRNLYEYSKLYSGSEPILSEGDIFEIKVKLYIGDSNDANDDANDANRDANHEANAANLEANIDESILSHIKDDPKITQQGLADMLKISRSTVQRTTKRLTEEGRIERIGGTRGYWKVIDQSHP